MRGPQLDILKRERDGSFVWIEAARDKNLAVERITQLARVNGADYLVFDQESQEVVATTAKQAKQATR